MASLSDGNLCTRRTARAPRHSSSLRAPRSRPVRRIRTIAAGCTATTWNTLFAIGLLLAWLMTGCASSDIRSTPQSYLPTKEKKQATPRDGGDSVDIREVYLSGFAYP